MLKRAIGVAGLMGLLLYSATANAADAVTVEQGYDWSGLYVGAHAGVLWGDVDYSENFIDGFEPYDPADFSVSPSGDGFVGGLYGGFNFQVDQIVLGLEGDFGWGGIDIDAGSSTVNDYSAFSSSWNAHVRARAGFAIDRALIFVAGGLAMADLELDDIDPAFSKDSSVHTGWTIGAGIDYAATENLLIRAEYLYDDYGDADFAISGPIYNYTGETSFTASTLRLGIAYKF